MKNFRYIVLLTLGLIGLPLTMQAEERPYLCEVGVAGGCGYYVGDAAPHIFMNVREAYGVHFRYKFTKRWAVQMKASGQRISGHDYTIRGEQLDTRWTSQMIGVDMMAEFNFFRFGTANKYDKRIRPYTPYIFLGVGVGMYNGEWFPSNTVDKTDIMPGTRVAAYIPLGIGFKWKFHDCIGLNIAWQHNIYTADNLEARETLDNKYQLNGWNWMNCDLTGMVTVGIVFEFAKAKKPCKICNTD